MGHTDTTPTIIPDGTDRSNRRAIAEIVIGHRYRRELGDIAGLAASIDDVGLLHPVVITPEGRLIAGARRLAACKRLGWVDVPVHVVPLAEIVRGECQENTARKDFLPTEWVAIAEAVKPLLEEAAKARQMAGLKLCPTVDLGQTLPKVKKGKARDQAAAYVGVSGFNLDKAAAVVAAAEAEPEKFAPLVDEMDRTGKVNGAHKKLKKLRQAAQIIAEPPPLPAGPFRVIIADPPWSYRNRPDDPSHRASNPYPDMTTADICAMPIRERAHDAAIVSLEYQRDGEWHVQAMCRAIPRQVAEARRAIARRLGPHRRYRIVPCSGPFTIPLEGF